MCAVCAVKADFSANSGRAAVGYNEVNDWTAFGPVRNEDIKLRDASVVVCIPYSTCLEGVSKKLSKGFALVRTLAMGNLIKFAT